MAGDPLDDFLAEIPTRAHRSARRLAKTVRAAYPIGVPALIMKSSTDRFGAAAGYSFHLGTPDANLRRIASWLLTGGATNQTTLLKLTKRLWKRHLREDVALAALLLANLNHTKLNTEPWSLLASLISKKEPAEALLLSIEELLRAGRAMPSEALLIEWCDGKVILGHLALLTIHVGTTRGERLSEEIAAVVGRVSVPPGDSLLGRIKAKLTAP